METTAYLLELLAAANTHTRSGSELRLSISMAICRFVNGVVDQQQQHKFAAPVSSIADRLGLPKSLVEIRHDGTHNALPHLDVLLGAARQTLRWLDLHYWTQPPPPVEAVRVDELGDTLRSYAAGGSAESRLAIAEDIWSSLASETDKEALISALVHDGHLLAPSDPGPTLAKLLPLWAPLLQLSAQRWPRFICATAGALLQKLQSEGEKTLFYSAVDDAARRAYPLLGMLLEWAKLFSCADAEFIAISTPSASAAMLRAAVPAVVAKAFLGASIWTLALIDHILRHATLDPPLRQRARRLHTIYMATLGANARKEKSGTIAGPVPLDLAAAEARVHELRGRTPLRVGQGRWPARPIGSMACGSASGLRMAQDDYVSVSAAHLRPCDWRTALSAGGVGGGVGGGGGRDSDSAQCDAAEASGTGTGACAEPTDDALFSSPSTSSASTNELDTIRKRIRIF